MRIDKRNDSLELRSNQTLENLFLTVQLIN